MHISPAFDLTQQEDHAAAREMELVELRSIVREALRTLTNRQRCIVLLAFWFELPLSEIAALLGITRQSVHESYDRALFKLRAALIAVQYEG